MGEAGVGGAVYHKSILNIGDLCKLDVTSFYTLCGKRRSL